MSLADAFSVGRCEHPFGEKFGVAMKESVFEVVTVVVHGGIDVAAFNMSDHVDVVNIVRM